MIEALSYIPEISAAAGYAAGQVMEQRARNTIEENRQALLGSHEAAQADELSRQGRLHRTFAQLALLGAVTGFALGEAWKPNDTQRTDKGLVVLVADRAYDTGINGSAKRVNAVARHFTDINKLHVKTIVAHNRSHDALDNVQQLPQIHPFGAPSMNEAVSAALENVHRGNPGGDSEKNPGVAVLAITDNDAIGHPDAVVAQARQAGDVPVYVANVGSDKGVTAHDLKDVAHRTDGHYWHIKDDSKKVAETLSQEVTHQEIPNSAGSDQTSWKIAGFALLALFGRQFYRRKSETAVS